MIEEEIKKTKIHLEILKKTFIRLAAKYKEALEEKGHPSSTRIKKKLIKQLKCKICLEVIGNKNMFIEHIQCNHTDKTINNFFIPCSYNEIQDENSDLPKKIYKCGHCNYYVKGYGYENPTSSIIYHIQNDCPKVDRSSGYPKMSFSVIDNVDEIRENIFNNLPRLHRCNICDVRINRINDSDLLLHIIDKHIDYLFEDYVLE